MKRLIFVTMLAFYTSVFAAGSPSVAVNQAIIDNTLNQQVAINNLQDNPTPGSNVDQLATPLGPEGNPTPGSNVNQLATPLGSEGNPSDMDNQDSAGGQGVACSDWITRDTCSAHSCTWITVSSNPNVIANTCN